MINYATLKKFVTPEHLKVLELSPSLPVETVRRGAAFIKLVWGEA